MYQLSSCVLSHCSSLESERQREDPQTCNWSQKWGQLWAPLNFVRPHLNFSACNFSAWNQVFPNSTRWATVETSVLPPLPPTVKYFWASTTRPLCMEWSLVARAPPACPPGGPLPLLQLPLGGLGPGVQSFSSRRAGSCCYVLERGRVYCQQCTKAPTFPQLDSSVYYSINLP